MGSKASASAAAWGRTGRWGRSGLTAVAVPLRLPFGKRIASTASAESAVPVVSVLWLGP